MTRSFRNLLWFLGAFVITFYVGIAIAASTTLRRVPTIPGSQPVFVDSTGVNYYQSRPSGMVRITPTAARYAIKTPVVGPSPGVELSSTRNLKIPAGLGWESPYVKEVPVADKITIPRNNIAAAGRILARTSLPIFIAAGLYQMVQDNGIENIDGELKRSQGDFDPNYSSYCPSGKYPTSYQFNKSSGHSVFQSGTRTTFLQARLAAEGQAHGHCPGLYPGPPPAAGGASIVPASSSSYPYYEVLTAKCSLSSGSVVNMATYQIRAICSNCPAGGCPNQQFGYVPVTDQEIEDAISGESPENLVNAVEGLVNADQPIDIPGDSPATITPQQTTFNTQPVVTTTTTVNPDGTTTTRTREETKKLTVSSSGTTANSNTITYNVTNHTVIRNENGDVIQEEEQGGGEQQEEPDYSFSDAAFPQIPDLYEQKYPDGIVGVWNAKRSELLATGFVSSIANMFPSLGGGACPTFGLDVNIGGAWGSFGSHNLNVCWVLQVVGLIMLATACFTAWWIIFR